MKNTKQLIVFALIAIISAGCACKPQKNVITQISTIDAILAGNYGGFVTIEQLSEYGDTGIGTFDSLDGEMAYIDGVAYQVVASGEVYETCSEMTSPFASMVWFEADKTFIAKNIDYKQLCSDIDSKIGSENIPAAIRIDGKFDFMHTRSVPAQSKPYPPLVEVVKSQPEFTAENIKGTIVGFRLPEFAGKINVPGYHLHFIADDKSCGGHLLDLRIAEAAVSIASCNEIRIILPIEDADFKSVNLKTDRTEDMEFSEKKR